MISNFCSTVSDKAQKSAWLKSEWIGPSQGQLDPVKEITAKIMAVTEGFSTHEDSTVELTGGDWNANMNKLERENEKKRMILNNQLNQTQNNTTTSVQNSLQKLIQATIKDTIQNCINEIKEG